MEKVQGEVVSVAKKPVPDASSVVSQVPEVKKRNGVSKLFRGFFVEDFKTVRGNVVQNILLPSLKNGLFNIITGTVSMWLWGKNGGGPAGSTSPYRPWLNPYGYTGYNGYYKSPSAAVTSPAGRGVTQGDTLGNVGVYRSTDVYDPYMIQYYTWDDAEKVYVELCKKISMYGLATVKDLFTASKLTNPEVVSVDWGWYDIPTHTIIATGDFWILKLPQPQYVKGVR